MKAPSPLPLEGTLPSPSPSSPKGRGACCPHLAQPSPAVPGRSPRPPPRPPFGGFHLYFLLRTDRPTFFYLYVVRLSLVERGRHISAVRAKKDRCPARLGQVPRCPDVIHRPRPGQASTHLRKSTPPQPGVGGEWGHFAGLYDPGKARASGEGRRLKTLREASSAGAWGVSPRGGGPSPSLGRGLPALPTVAAPSLPASASHTSCRSV